MANTVTAQALEGYHASGSRCHYLATSISSDAWHIGAWLFQSGRTIPRDVRKSRGDSYHVNDMKVRIHYVNGATQIERIA
jgi:hypothetical protein